MGGSFAAIALRRLPWRGPLEVLRANTDQPHACALLSDGSETGRWSYFAAAPARFLTLAPGDGAQAFSMCAAMLGALSPGVDSAPPFAGGLIGVAAYDLARAIEPTAGVAHDPHWPALEAGLYLAVLAFDHDAHEVIAIGRGVDDHAARTHVSSAAAWWARRAPEPLGRAALGADAVRASAPGEYAAVVAKVVDRIARGDIFQANIAARWSGALRPGVAPADLMTRLAQRSPAPFAAFHASSRRAIVSHSPERFLRVDRDGWVEAQPIKGSRPRARAPDADLAAARDLGASSKDRAENLMIVDLMRNDLARESRAGSVEVAQFCALRSFPTLHHLVSTVRSRLNPGRSALDLFGGAFPPGSITGAPKVEAMRVIAAFEPPRGPFFGSSFWLGLDGALDSNVLIRTLALRHVDDAWCWEARAGAGIVAESEPAGEALEAGAKIAAILDALTRADA